MDTAEPILEDQYASRLQAGDEHAFRYIMDRYLPIIIHFSPDRFRPASADPPDPPKAGPSITEPATDPPMALASPLNFPSSHPRYRSFARIHRRD
jgi:hypothetical protein